MKKYKLALFTILCACCMTFAISAGADTRYEIVRQGSIGETVQRVQIRLRDLDYLHFKPTGSFRGMTVTGTIEFQKMQVTDDGSWVAADGEAGEQTQSILFSPRAIRASISSSVHIPIGPALHGSASLKGKMMSWDKVKERLTAGSSYKVFDYNTGKSFKIKYIGGEKHAEVECETADDTQVFLEVFGGEYNYSKRAMILQIDKDTIVAASMIGMPHGKDSVSGNDMGGYICLFFDGSKSHVGNVTDVEHQKQIYTAAGM